MNLNLGANLVFGVWPFGKVKALLQPQGTLSSPVNTPSDVLLFGNGDLASEQRVLLPGHPGHRDRSCPHSLVEGDHLKKKLCAYFSVMLMKRYSKLCIRS